MAVAPGRPGALTGCAQLPGNTLYLGNGPDLRFLAETQALEARWAEMSSAVEARPVTLVAAETREQPVIRASVAGPAEGDMTGSVPVADGSRATTRRSL